MGRGIAVSLARVGISVIAVESDKKLMETGRQMVIGMLERDAKRRKRASLESNVLSVMK